MNDLEIKSIMFVLIAIAMAVVGFAVFNSVSDAVSGPMASSQMNASVNIGNSVFNIVGPVLVIGAAMVIVGLLYGWVRTSNSFKIPGKIAKFFATTTIYFGYGLCCLAIIAIPVYMIHFLFTYTVVDGNTGQFIEVLKWIGIGIGGYFGIAGIGYLFKKTFVKKLKKRLEESELEENMKELPGVN